MLGHHRAPAFEIANSPRFDRRRDTDDVEKTSDFASDFVSGQERSKPEGYRSIRVFERCSRTEARNRQRSGEPILGVALARCSKSGHCPPEISYADCSSTSPRLGLLPSAFIPMSSRILGLLSELEDISLLRDLCLRFRRLRGRQNVVHCRPL